MANTRWKLFERYVAAIEKVDHPGAVVRWNETIAGQQFDVTIRGRQGRYDFLIVVECRDKGRRVERRQVSALAQEAQSIKASKAVLVSRAGFQQGCLEKARETGVVLVQLEEVHEIPARWLETQLAIWLHDIRALDEGGATLRDLDNSEAATATLRGPTHSASLSSFLARASRRLGIDRLVEGQPHVDSRVRLPAGTTLEAGGWLGSASAIAFRAVLAPASLPRDGLDPAILGRSLRVTDVVSAEVRTYSLWDLEPGLDTTFRVGDFYLEVATGNESLCERVDGHRATLFVVRSRQFGKVYSFGPFDVVSADVVRRYVRIEDAALILELKAHASKVGRRATA